MRLLADGASNEKGQSLIEFVFILPFLLMFLFTIVDFGIALDRRIVLQHAVAEGARQGAVNPDITSTISRTAAQSQGLLDTLADPNAVTVCFTDEDGDGTYGEVGESIVVQANFDYNFTAAFGDIASAFGATPPTISMNPSATKRLETSASVAPVDQCPPPPP